MSSGKTKYVIDDEDLDDEEIEEIMSDDTLTKSERLIASRKCKLESMDSDYKLAIVYLSYRVACPRCRAQKGRQCIGNAHNRAPAHKVRLRSLKFSSKKVLENLNYAMNSCTWKEVDWYKHVKEWDETREQREKDDDAFIQNLIDDPDYDEEFREEDRKKFAKGNYGKRN